MLYDEENLRGFVASIDRKDIEQQLRRQASIYLPFPHETVRVMMVDSLESLRYMTQVIGIPFPQEEISTNSSSGSVSGKRSSRFIQLQTLQDAYTNGLVAMRQSVAMTDVITSTVTSETDKVLDTEKTTHTTSVYQDVEFPENSHIETVQEQSITTKAQNTNKRTHSNTTTKTPDRKQGSSSSSSSSTVAANASANPLSSSGQKNSATKHKKQNTADSSIVTSTTVLPPVPPASDENTPMIGDSSAKLNTPITTIIQNIVGLDTEWDVAVQDTLLNNIRVAKNQSAKSSKFASPPQQKSKNNNNGKDLSEMNGDEGGADILQVWKNHCIFSRLN
jgi:hypothetical protein